MEALAKKIGNALINISNTAYSDEDKDVYYYGIECFLNNFFSDLFLLIWSLGTHTLIQNIIWLIPFSFYRHHAGGIHAGTNIRCIIASTLLGMSNIVNTIYPNILLSHKLVLFVICLVFTCLFAPYESTKKELSSDEKFLEIIFSITIIFIVFGIAYIAPAIYSSSMLYSITIGTILLILSKIKISYSHSLS